MCHIEATGMRASLQDGGRIGWARYGVPPGGAMDDHAAMWANRLLQNEPGAPVVEFLGRGARVRFTEEAWIAIAGAATNPNAWRAVRVRADEVVSFGETAHGLWTYVAVEGGFEGPRWLGSVDSSPLQAGDVLARHPGHFALPSGVSARVVPWTEQRDFAHPPVLRIWPGPQWPSFSPAERQRFLATEWSVSPQSNRVGYRLTGACLNHEIGELLSEPVIVGTVQVPPGGEPIVTMRDGPTVGGYAKLGVVERADVSWLAQIQPGQRVRFRNVDGP